MKIGNMLYQKNVCEVEDCSLSLGNGLRMMVSTASALIDCLPKGGTFEDLTSDMLLAKQPALAKANILANPADLASCEIICGKHDDKGEVTGLKTASITR